VAVFFLWFTEREEISHREMLRIRQSQSFGSFDKTLDNWIFSLTLSPNKPKQYEKKNPYPDDAPADSYIYSRS
jgi:hypothetical protein